MLFSEIMLTKVTTQTQWCICLVHSSDCGCIADVMTLMSKKLDLDGMQVPLGYDGSSLCSVWESPRFGGKSLLASLGDLIG